MSSRFKWWTLAALVASAVVGGFAGATLGFPYGLVAASPFAAIFGAVGVRLDG